MYKLSNRLVLIFFIPLLIVCGGGSDVGNPDINGIVYDNDGTPANGAMIVLGMEGTSYNSGSQIIEDSNGLVISVKPGNFDTAYSDSRGQFTIDNVEPGEYLIVASKGSQLGIEKIAHTSYGYSEVNETLGVSADIQIQSRSLPNNSALSFVAAQISGTNYYTTPDSSGNLTFNSVPSGILDIMLYRSDKSIVTFKKFETKPGCSAVLVADPNRSIDFWTPKDCGNIEYTDRPYILSSSPGNASTGNEAKENAGKPYDVDILFSHPMNTRLTSQSLKAFSSDNNIALDSLWWQDNYEVFITFCSKDSSDNCTRAIDYFRIGVKYSVVVDTTAQTMAGTKFAGPDTLWFVPEP